MDLCHFIKQTLQLRLVYLPVFVLVDLEVKILDQLGFKVMVVFIALII